MGEPACFDEGTVIVLKGRKDGTMLTAVMASEYQGSYYRWRYGVENEPWGCFAKIGLKEG